MIAEIWDDTANRCLFLNITILGCLTNQKCLLAEGFQNAPDWFKDSCNVYGPKKGGNNNGVLVEGVIPGRGSKFSRIDKQNEGERAWTIGAVVIRTPPFSPFRVFSLFRFWEKHFRKIHWAWLAVKLTHQPNKPYSAIWKQWRTADNAAMVVLQFRSFCAWSNGKCTVKRYI